MSTPKQLYDAILRRIAAWAVADVCGSKDKLPTPEQQEAVNERLAYALQKGLFHLDPLHHIKQSYFLRAKAPFVVAHSGNKWGKTYALLAKGLTATFGCALWDPDQTELYNSVKYEPPIRVMLVVQDLTTSLSEDIVPRLKQLIPWDALITRVSRVQGNVIDAIEWFNGSTWKILSHVQEDERYEGWSAHLILWNEPMPRSKYIGACRGAVEFNAPQLASFTPLSEAWLYDQVYLRSHLVHDEASFLDIETKRPEIVVVEGSIYENPYLAEEAIRRFEAQIPEHEREARLFGKWQHLSGLVFKQWSRSKHVRQLAEVI